MPARKKKLQKGHVSRKIEFPIFYQNSSNKRIRILVDFTKQKLALDARASFLALQKVSDWIPICVELSPLHCNICQSILSMCELNPDKLFTINTNSFSFTITFVSIMVIIRTMVVSMNKSAF